MVQIWPGNMVGKVTRPVRFESVTRLKFSVLADRQAGSAENSRSMGLWLSRGIGVLMNRRQKAIELQVDVVVFPSFQQLLHFHQRAGAERCWHGVIVCLRQIGLDKIHHRLTDCRVRNIQQGFLQIHHLRKIVSPRIAVAYGDVSQHVISVPGSLSLNQRMQ